MTAFGKKLKDLRKGKGLSQDALAELLALKSGKQTIYNWELGKTEPPLSQIRRIADVFGMSVAALLDEGGEEAAQEPKPGIKCIPIDDYVRLLEDSVRLNELLKNQEGKS